MGTDEMGTDETVPSLWAERVLVHQRPKLLPLSGILMSPRPSHSGLPPSPLPWLHASAWPLDLTPAWCHFLSGVPVTAPASSPAHVPCSCDSETQSRREASG